MNEPIIRDAEAAPRQDFDQAQRQALMVGAVALAATAVGYFVSAPVDFYRAYLVGWLWAFGIAVGLFALNMLSHVAGGDWGVVMRRVLEASGRTLPFFLLAGLPLAFGLEHVYSWVSPEVGADGRYVDTLLEHKRAYLNVPFFLARAVIYFAVWTVIAYLLSAWSQRHDVTGDAALKVRMKRLSAAGLIVYVLLSTFASVDWVMSVDPYWFSSLFGLGFVAGHVLSAFAFAVPVMLFLSRRRPLSELVRTKLYHDYGKFILAAVMMWGYFMISQYLIIWSGNLPEEILWYIDRSTGGWQTLSVALIIAHFAVPFPLLLSADLKKRPRWLVAVACWLLVARWLDLYWQVAPSLHGETTFHWLNLTVPIGLGGLWLWLLIGQLKNRALVPVRDPALGEFLAHG